MSRPTTSWIVCAAIRHESGDIICGARHFDKIMYGQIKRDGRKWIKADQGFIDQWGNFIDRIKAATIATENGQRVAVTGNEGTLFSEDLY